jgi:restriction system protein
VSRNYYRVRLGVGSSYANQCHDEGWFGGGWGFTEDLSAERKDDWREFNAKFIPIFLDRHPDKTRVAAGLACGMLYTICWGIAQNDIVLGPDGQGSYWVGQVVSDYYFVPGGELAHRRKVDWMPVKIARDQMSEGLRGSTGTPGTVRNVTSHAEEIERLVAGTAPPAVVANDTTIEDAATFALEKHLEDFLVQNWAATELGRDFNIYVIDGEKVGQQFPTDTGPIDILAVAKDGKSLLIVELKRGRASDVVVGQVQRYMGYVQEELAEEGQAVRGCIVALEDDLKLRRALSVAPNIDFYRYQVNFNLFRASSR